MWIPQDQTHRVSDIEDIIVLSRPPSAQDQPGRSTLSSIHIDH